jgi:hypothetical protein
LIRASGASDADRRPIGSFIGRYLKLTGREKRTLMVAGIAGKRAERALVEDASGAYRTTVATALIAEAARFLRLHRRMVERACTRGELPAQKVGRQ